MAAGTRAPALPSQLSPVVGVLIGLGVVSELIEFGIAKVDGSQPASRRPHLDPVDFMVVDSVVATCHLASKVAEAAYNHMIHGRTWSRRNTSEW